MARAPRKDVVDPQVVGVYHCYNRCVRQCFLLGDNAITGHNFDHRKQWFVDRFELLAGCFAIDLLTYAVMDNHFHVVLRNRPDVLETWSDEEVARRWLLLCPVRKTADGQAAEPSEAEIAAIVSVAEEIANCRARLGDLSWYMKMLDEGIAKQANREEGRKGRFWDDRFGCVRLCDDAAILACSVYVDLNPIRACLAETLEGSDFTSAQRRIAALLEPTAQQQEDEATNIEQAAAAAETADAFLAPVPLDEAQSPVGPVASKTGARCSDRGFLPMTVEQYLELLDWTARQLVSGKRGATPTSAPPILERLGIAERDWLELTTNFGRLFHTLAGRKGVMAQQRLQRARRFRAPGAPLLGAPHK
jgi:hypothetical protein